MTKQSYEDFKNQRRNMVNYRDLSDEAFEIRMQELYNQKCGISSQPIETKSIENEAGIWINEEEAKEAKKCYEIYIKSRNITDPSDIALLKNLIFYEMQLKRIYKAINDEHNRKMQTKQTYDVPSGELRTVNDINQKIIEIKKVLGLAQEQKGEDPLLYINQFKKKCFKWAKDMYQASRFRICPHCSKPIMFYIRPEVWETCKHPWFRDKVLANDWLWKCFKDKKPLTKEDMAKILLGKECKSTLYIDWLERKIYGIPENKDPLTKESGDSVTA